MPIRLVLAGQPSVVRDGLRSLLTAVPDFELVAQAGDRTSAAVAVQELRPDVLVVDTGSPETDVEGLASPETAVELARVAQLHGAGVVVLAGRLDAPAVLHAVRGGVSGYVLRDDDTESLIAAVRSTAVGEAWLSPPAARQLVDHIRTPEPTVTTPPTPGQRSPLAEVLSEREIAVLRLVALGRSNAEIADDLTLARSTVKTHVSRILAKLELRDRVQLTAFAHQNDLA